MKSKAKAPLSAHLAELRRRLIYVAAVFLLTSAVCFYFAAELFDFLAMPLQEALRAEGLDGLGGEGLVYTSLLEVFSVHIKLALLAGAVFSFPFMALQGWAFLEPGLYPKEKAPGRKFLLLVVPFFAMGAGFCYWVVLPNAWRFFIGFSEGITPLPKASEYFILVLRLIFAFGLVFLLPIALLLLAQIKLVNAAILRKGRKYAVILAFLLAAILTPPDVVSQILLAVPILLLYEVSIFLVARK